MWMRVLARLRPNRRPAEKTGFGAGSEDWQCACVFNSQSEEKMINFCQFKADPGARPLA